MGKISKWIHESDRLFLITLFFNPQNSLLSREKPAKGNPYPYISNGYLGPTPHNQYMLYQALTIKHHLLAVIMSNKIILMVVGIYIIILL